MDRQLIKLVKHYESLHDGDLNLIGLQPKMCPAGLWTEGYGRLVRYNNGKPIKGKLNKSKAYLFSKIHNEKQAEEALIEDLQDYKDRVKSLGLDVSQSKESALVSFAYNVGFEALKNSTLLKKIRENAPLKEIDFEFRRWNKSGGKVLKGLELRRVSESSLYCLGELNF